MPFQNFRPLPMRITHRQYERLQLARDHDHLAIQEHVRRALDFYLDDLEKRQGRSPSLKSPEPAGPATGAAATGGLGTAPSL